MSHRGSRGDAIHAGGGAGRRIRHIDLLCRATRAERTAVLPGDDAIAHAILRTNHAIDIKAPPEGVWPWLVQMGADRAGWYSYDLLDNGGRPSSEQIVSKLQQISVGDIFPALPGARDCFVLTDFEANRYLTLSVPAEQAGQEAGRSPFTRDSGLLVFLAADGELFPGDHGRAAA